MIHPTAVVHPHAELDSSVEVGPYSIIEAGVMVGAGSRIGPHVHLLGPISIGLNNRFHTGCVVGDDPQDLKYEGQSTRLVIGDGNVFREHFTAHRSNSETEETTIGSNNLFMSGSHVGHNCHIGSNVVFANGALAAGHVRIEDRAFLSGSCLVHQFARVGTLAMMQGGAAVSQDLPPYTMATGENGICGLNVVGLRRAGVTSEARQELRELYRLLFRRGVPMTQALAESRGRFTGELSQRMIEFIAAARKGVCRHVGAPGFGDTAD
jgi:UDP-N-acetylglucosamine acyltransferase